MYREYKTFRLPVQLNDQRANLRITEGEPLIGSERPKNEDLVSCIVHFLRTDGSRPEGGSLA